jgi:hypothetical protein
LALAQHKPNLSAECHGLAQYIRIASEAHVGCDRLFLQNLSTIALFGLAVGVLLDSDHQPFVSTDTKLTLMMSLIMAITMTLSAVSSLQPFGVKRVLLVRERRAGLDMLALFVAKCLVDMADNLWQVSGNDSPFPASSLCQHPQPFSPDKPPRRGA